MASNKKSGDSLGAPTENMPTENASPGRSLYTLHERSLLWLVGGVLLYTLASLGLLGWAVAGPQNTPGHLVLRTGHVKVDQFYSGLALSLLLAPAAIMVRRIANQLALMHPFALASKQPLTMAHLNKMMDPGLVACATLAKYSTMLAVSQSFLLIAGAFLVPIGTLIITTGQHAWPVAGTAVIGRPSQYISVDMGLDYCGRDIDGIDLMTKESNAFTAVDSFSTQLTKLLFGRLIQQGGSVSKTPSLLGPSPTSNITMQSGLRYDGVVTYHWESGCEYSDDILYSFYKSSESTWVINFTWPDGNMSSTADYSLYSLPFLGIWSDPAIRTGNGTIPLGPVTYFVVAHGVDDTTNVAEARPFLDTHESWWISRVKCTPTLRWTVSNCTWTDGGIGECIHAEGCGLDALTFYLRALPHYLHYLDETQRVFDHILGMAPLTAALSYDPTSPNSGGVFRAPVLADYTNLYGMIAESIALITSNGFYGAAVVPTGGTELRPTYIIRIYILAIVIALLILVPVVTLWNLASNIKGRRPLRRATFLTIANAVRGPWWDTTLWGGCVLPPRELEKRHQDQQIMFGVDVKTPQHVGLAPKVTAVEMDHFYQGLSGGQR